MTELAHSKWSASGFESIMLCPGKKVLEAGKPNSSSKYAAEGTAAHQVLTWALAHKRHAADYLGEVIEADGFTFVVDEDMARHVQVTVDYCNDLAGDDGVIFADIRVNYSEYLDTPEVEAWGTADVIIARGDELIVVDFKYGMGVEVSAERNPQMSLYGLGALQAYQGIAADFERVRLAISQPRIKTAPSEYDLSVADLEAWGRSTARSAVISCKIAESTSQDAVWQETFLRPGEKQCRFCKAKASTGSDGKLTLCPALRDELTATTTGQAVADLDEFTDLTAPKVSDATDQDWLEAVVSKADMFEDLFTAARAELERRLLAGVPSKQFKLVQGKRGSRAWSDAKVAEATLKTMRIKIEDMYDFKLISPTSAEKLAKSEVIGKRQWPKLQELITQSEGKPHVAPVSDARPALDIKPVVDDFADESLA